MSNGRVSRRAERIFREMTALAYQFTRQSEKILVTAPPTESIVVPLALIRAASVMGLCLVENGDADIDTLEELLTSQIKEDIAAYRIHLAMKDKDDG